jgi:type I restriction enzyme S subunit
LNADIIKELPNPSARTSPHRRHPRQIRRLTNSITEGLPREIELRQKQYEYYRDLLLSFPSLKQ